MKLIIKKDLLKGLIIIKEEQNNRNEISKPQTIKNSLMNSNPIFINKIKKENEIEEHIKNQQKVENKFNTLENVLKKESMLKSNDLDLSKKLELYFIKDINAFDKDNFEYRLFKNIQKLIKKKSTEQKLKYIFVKIYQNLEDTLLNSILYSKNTSNLIELKKSSREFHRFFNWFYFDNRKLKKSECRIYNPKKKCLSFNFRFIHMIFQNKFFYDRSMNFLNSDNFRKEICNDIFVKIEMILNLIKINRFKSEESFFESFKKKAVNKIPWKICQAYDARKFFLEKI